MQVMELFFFLKKYKLLLFVIDLGIPPPVHLYLSYLSFIYGKLKLIHFPIFWSKFSSFTMSNFFLKTLHPFSFSINMIILRTNLVQLTQLDIYYPQSLFFSVLFHFGFCLFFYFLTFVLTRTIIKLGRPMWTPGIISLGKSQSYWLQMFTILLFILKYVQSIAV